MTHRDTLDATLRWLPEAVAAKLKIMASTAESLAYEGEAPNALIIVLAALEAGSKRRADSMARPPTLVPIDAGADGTDIDALVRLIGNVAARPSPAAKSPREVVKPAMAKVLQMPPRPARNGGAQ